MAQGILVLRVERTSGLRVDHHGGEGGIVPPAPLMVRTLEVVPAARLCGRREADQNGSRCRGDADRSENALTPYAHATRHHSKTNRLRQ